MSTSLVSARPRVSPSVLIVLLLALCAGAFSQQGGSHPSQIWRSEPQGITINHVSALAAPLRTARTLRGDGSTVAPPTVSKAFGASSIPLNGTTSLTFTISNPNTTVDLSGVTFSDTLPNTTGALAVASTPGVTNTCGGTVTATAGTGVISLYGATLIRSTSCTLSVNVTGTAAGDAVNITGTISSTESGTGLTSNTAMVKVVAPPTISTPTISKAFGAASIALNGTTSLTFTISNPNSNVSVTGLSFTDSLPAGLVVATPNALSNTCGGTATATGGSGTVSLSGGTLAASASCVVSVNVRGTTAGTKNNTVVVNSSECGASTAATATVTVVAPPTISKLF